MHAYRRVSLFLVLLIFGIFIVNSAATLFSWYWHLGWLDTAMHVLGGIFLGVLAPYLYYLSGYIEPRHEGFVFTVCIAIGLASFVGISWEVFEYVVDKINSPEISTLQPSIADTLADLVSDIVGAVIGGIIFNLLADWSR